MRERHHSLDGLRGVAALAIVGMHTAIHFRLAGIASHGYLAVPFFFTLSGLVIAEAYEHRLSTTMHVSEFAEVRLARVLASWTVGRLFGLVSPATLMTYGALAKQVVLGWFLPMRLGGVAYPLDSPQWSLVVELVGNAAHALLLRWLTTAVVLSISLLGLLALLVVTLHHSGLAVGSSWDTLGAGYAVFLFSYPVGILIHRMRRVLPELTMPFWLAISVLSSILLFPALHGKASAVFDFICAAFIFPVLVVSGLTQRLDFSARSFAAKAGEVSYPLYIIHSPLVLLSARFFAYGPSINRIAVAVLTDILVVGLCWLLTITVDRRGSSLLRTHLRLGPSREPSAGPA